MSRLRDETGTSEANVNGVHRTKPFVKSNEAMTDYGCSRCSRKAEKAACRNYRLSDCQLLNFIQPVGGLFIGLGVDPDDILVLAGVHRLGRAPRRALRRVLALTGIRISPLDTCDVHTHSRSAEVGLGISPAEAWGEARRAPLGKVYFVRATGTRSRLAITRSIMPYSTPCSGLMM